MTTPVFPTIAPATSAANDRAFWRYYFAGQALAGLMANHRWTAPDVWMPDQDAKSALSQADALLAALEEGSKARGMPERWSFDNQGRKTMEKKPTGYVVWNIRSGLPLAAFKTERELLDYLTRADFAPDYKAVKEQYSDGDEHNMTPYEFLAGWCRRHGAAKEATA